MNEILYKYLPKEAVDRVFRLIKEEGVYLKIVRERRTRHGDYQRLPSGQHQITINASLNKYQFLITLIHEIAHLTAYKRFGARIQPHGKKWKYTFRQLMLPFLTPTVFPKELLPLLARHFKNPKASSDTDAALSVALKKFDPPTDKNFIFEIPEGSLFRIYNGKTFKKGPKRIKRYECQEVSSGKIYVFQPHAQVELLSAP